MCLPLTLNLLTQNATLKLVIKNAPTDEIALLNNQPITLERKTKDILRIFQAKLLQTTRLNVFSRGLKFIPTPLVPSSNKSLLKDFDHFARTMRLKYMLAKKQKTSAHPFHVKSTWQPPVQNSVAPENYLEETKLEIASAIFRPQFDNISANERNAISALKRNNKINLKKVDKGTTTIILDTAQKIDEGLQQLSNASFKSLSHLPLCRTSPGKQTNWLINYTVRDTST